MTLPTLRRVLGDGYLGPAASAPELPALAEVGSNLAIFPEMGAVTLGERLHVHGKLFVQGDCSLLAAPGLYAIDGPLATWFGSRGTLSLPDLHRAHRHP